MIKFYCDICGKDITEDISYPTITISNGYQHQKCLDVPQMKEDEVFDLCSDCCKKIERILYSNNEVLNDMENN